MSVINVTYLSPDLETDTSWTKAEKVLFRFFFIYFFLQIVPLDWKFYRDLFAVNWFDLHYRDIFYLSRYTPRLFADSPSFADWGVIALVALAGTLVWGFLDTKREEYTSWQYALRVLLRYRLAAGVIGYGFIKLFPLQSPYPSLSNLNTYYGDFTDWKLFSLSLGIVPSYESFLGGVEILAGLLLLNRKTTTVATLIILPFTGNVFMSNLAYSGGEYVYSFFLITIAFFLLSFDIKRLFTLLTLEKPTFPNRYFPVFEGKWKVIRIVLKSAFIFLFVFLYGFKSYAGYQTGSYQYPQKAGLSHASGLYNVRTFRINSKELPYSKKDPVRWQDVVFEKWATISVRLNQPVSLPPEKRTEELYEKDEDRQYELAGTTGRTYYSYQLDTTQHLLYLKNRNKDKPNDMLILHYSRPDSTQIILSGLTQSKDTLYVVLDKIQKKYLLEEVQRQGRQKALKL
ncbi:DoxX family protein [Cytophagaceae bacterium DM2B3-1]|uniref:DoxX family protein n=1 Tax=Xanthocytophaga flava TaxID=3048013 RepID=A0ABT7CU53_9BACT|nr:DoxX family protein [Xanthocytophaga flavus]MDJ1497262.1 DoxX family protein [Xanthocytophaga flavus]